MKKEELDLTFKLLEEHSKNTKRMYWIILFLIVVVLGQFLVPYFTENQDISQTIQDSSVVNSEVKNEVK